MTHEIKVVQTAAAKRKAAVSGNALFQQLMAMSPQELDTFLAKPTVKETEILKALVLGLQLLYLKT